MPNLRAAHDGPLSYKDFCSPPTTSSVAKEEQDMQRLENVIEVCVGCDMKPNQIRKVINAMVVNFELDDKYTIAHRTMYRKIDALYLKRIKENADSVNELKYIAFDERTDNTLQPKNQHKKESHCTFVTDTGDYIDHCTMEKNDAEAYCEEIHKVVENTGSKESLTFIASDGCPTNTGWENGSIRLLEEKLEKVFYDFCNFSNFLFQVNSTN